jgi:hypothetical protein
MNIHRTAPVILAILFSMPDASGAQTVVNPSSHDRIQKTTRTAKPPTAQAAAAVKKRRPPPGVRVTVTNRSFLDAGTEVRPGERKFLDYAFPPNYSPTAVIDYTGANPMGPHGGIMNPFGFSSNW